VNWAERAGEAERAVTERHVRRVCGVPGTALGRIGWPPTGRERFFLNWGYWWQAHLLDCVIDAQLRAPAQGRLHLVERLPLSIKLRNAGWTNDYLDDMAWLGLAMQRVADLGLETGRAQHELLTQLRDAWTPDAGGGIWWRRHDDFKNTPANGPAAIMHARAGEPSRAAELVEWLDATLVDPATGLIFDGIRVKSGALERATYTYCQGVFIGACLEVGATDEAERTVHAVAKHLAPGGVLIGGGTGDGGLFNGILARYLALAAGQLDGSAAERARDLVLSSAAACWQHAAVGPGGPVFGTDWNHPTPGARELSVQLSGWMLLEAAATLSS
jgi:predicted alpha-1,6-mannanase (GH76 family)